ncbi:hypothetical protein V6N11_051833 [Hibiscus sabdariffa]|uniref:Uncharacterized protein n=1 Tax=Hibiscus sabdariffa TaxID=183260 RepID=A0ABR2U875_9ROSI
MSSRGIVAPDTGPFNKTSGTTNTLSLEILVSERGNRDPSLEWWSDEVLRAIFRGIELEDEHLRVPTRVNDVPSTANDHKYLALSRSRGMNGHFVSIGAIGGAKCLVSFR